MRRKLKDKVLTLLERGLSSNEIADALDCTPEYVRATYSRSKHELGPEFLRNRIKRRIEAIDAEKRQLRQELRELGR